MKNWIGAAPMLIVGLIVGLSATTASAQVGDATKGERVFNMQCKACHTLERGGASVAGPNLHGLIGRKSGAGTNYSYSEVMRKFGIEWNDKTLAAYLRDPKADMPGTKMVYAGLKRQDQLADLIAYLREATK
jgi:cytochrome c